MDATTTTIRTVTPFRALRNFVALCLLLFTLACTTTVPPVEKVELITPTKKLIGIQLAVNESNPVSTHYLSRLRAVKRYIENSNVFQSVSSNSDSPIKLAIVLERSNISGSENGAASLSAATLFLVPVTIVNKTTLSAKIIADGIVLKEYEFSEQHTTKIGLANHNNTPSMDRPEYDAIENLVNTFLNSLQADKVIPAAPLLEEYFDDDEQDSDSLEL